MALQSGIKRRGSRYYARVVVPVDLRDAVGRNELAKSLNTSDPKVAKRAAPVVIEDWHRQFDDLRARRQIGELDFAQATWGHYTAELELDGQERADPDAPSLADFRAFSREQQLKALRLHLGRGETVLVHWAADKFIADNRLLIEKGSREYRELSFRLMRAQIEALERAGERDQGNYAGKPADPAVVRPVAPETPIAKPGEGIMEMFERYAKENPKRITEATLAQARRDIGTFATLVGKDFPVQAIDKKAVREWKALLLQYPVKAAELGVFKGMNMREAIKANVTVGKPIIGHKTVNRYMAGFGAFCNWLVAHDYIEASPASRSRSGTGGGSKPRRGSAHRSGVGRFQRRDRSPPAP